VPSRISHRFSSGRDPRDIEQLVRVMKKQSFWRLGVIGMFRGLGHRACALGHLG